MTLLPSSHEQVLNTIDWYLKKKIPFEYELQNDTINVISKIGSYTTSKKAYTINELNFIKQLKQHIIKNDLQAPFDKRFRTPESRKTVMYFKYNNSLKPGQEFHNLKNIDLTAAYWETAYKIGLFKGNHLLYLRGFSFEKELKKIPGPRKQAAEKLEEMIRTGKSDAIRKQVRLTAIGSLAKKKWRYKFDGKKQIELPVRRSIETEFLWDVICDHVGKLLLKVLKACGKDAIFFWVDGIYIQSSAAKVVERLFKQAGYKWKTHDITWLKTTDRHIILKCPEKIREIEVNGEKKMSDEFTFPFRNREVAKEFTGYNTDL